MDFIANKDITVLIQGYVPENELLNIITNVRNVLSGAQIVVSACNHIPDSVKAIADDWTEVADPGNFITGPQDPKPNNVDRQVASTFAGLQRVKTKYTLKFRKGFLLQNDNFKKQYYAYKSIKRVDHFEFFNNRVVIPICFTLNSRKLKQGMFCPSDLIIFGETDDLKKLFSCGLVSEAEKKWGGVEGGRYYAEQHIIINALRNAGWEVPCNDMFDYSEAGQIFWGKFLVSNYVIADYKYMGLKVTQKDLLYPSRKSECITLKDYLKSLRFYAS